MDEVEKIISWLKTKKQGESIQINKPTYEKILLYEDYLWIRKGITVVFFNNFQIKYYDNKPKRSNNTEQEVSKGVRS